MRSAALTEVALDITIARFVATSPLMSPVLIADPLEFARRGGRIADAVALSDLPRVRDGLADASGDVEYEACGAVQGEDSFLDLTIRATPRVVCQRCLESMAWPLVLHARLLLVPPGEVLPDADLEEDDFDPIEAVRDLDLHALVEDEVLLGMPLAPRHEEGCSAPASGAEDGERSPFAALARLRGAGPNDN